MKLGSLHASAAPLRARRMANSVKLRAQACSMRNNPHIMMFMPMYFPIGNRCSMKFVGTRTSLGMILLIEVVQIVSKEKEGLTCQSQKTKIKDRAKSAILCYNKLQVDMNTKNSCIAQRGFINIKKRIAYSQISSIMKSIFLCRARSAPGSRVSWSSSGTLNRARAVSQLPVRETFHFPRIVDCRSLKVLAWAKRLSPFSASKLPVGGAASAARDI